MNVVLCTSVGSGQGDGDNAAGWLGGLMIKREGEGENRGLEFQRKCKNLGDRSVVKNDVGLELKSQPVKKAEMFFDNPIWLSTKDAAIYLRKFRNIDGKPSEGAIRNAVWRGTLQARKWRRRLYIKKVDLDRLLQNSPFVNGG